MGDGALVVRFAEDDPAALGEELHRRIRGLATRITAARWPELREQVPAFTTLTLYLDPMPEARWTALESQLRAWLADPSLGEPVAGREVVIPVLYDGPDLPEMARLTGLEVTEVIRRHQAATYWVDFLGFSPGFPYMGGLDPALALPRKTKAVPVRAGDVGIGGSQAGIYPAAGQGGWWILGRTSAPLFDPRREDPVLLRPGDRVRFVAVEVL